MEQQSQISHDRKGTVSTFWHHMAFPFLERQVMEEEGPASVTCFLRASLAMCKLVVRAGSQLTQAGFPVQSQSYRGQLGSRGLQYPQPGSFRHCKSCESRHGRGQHSSPQINASTVQGRKE